MRRERRKARLNHDRWLVSYADFITLLFGLFVVLFAFAKADQKKQAEVSAAIQTAFRSMSVFGHVSPHAKNSPHADNEQQAAVPTNGKTRVELFAPGRVKDDLEKLRRDLERRLSIQLARHTVSIQMGRDGLVISLREAGFFSSGSALPRPETQPTLRQIAASLAHSPYDVRVEGHTDNVPMHSTEFDSNWELSSARATRIARLFLDLKAVEPDRLSVAGYAEFHPAAGNATAEGRAENRRVDLVVLPGTRIDFSDPPAAMSANPAVATAWRRISDP